MSQKFKYTVYRWRVRAGFLGILVSVVFSRPTPVSIAAGAAITAAGLALRAWACGHLAKEERLATSGPYRFTRNPLYLGNLILGIGVVAGSRSLVVLGIFAAYFLFFYPVVIEREKERMMELFPREYESYSDKVPLFFPKLRARGDSGKEKRFQWKLYKKNREMRALAGTLIFWAVLAAKLLLLQFAVF